MPITSIDSIHIPLEERLRSETYGNLDELAESLASNGQLQAILVRGAEEGEELPAGSKWVLVDGGRRLRAIGILRDAGRKVRGLDSGEVRYDSRDFAISDALENLLHEFYANEDREDFSWAEKAKFVRKVHEELLSRTEKPWPVELTAHYLKMTSRMVYNYLELTEDPELFESEGVQASESFRTAKKKLKIEKDKARRKLKAELREERPAEPGDYFGAAMSMVAQADCREWIRQFEDEHFDWIHWDPPYGGNQDGGAFGLHEKIDDTPEYAQGLITEMLPELERVLTPGGWMVIWFHPSMRTWLTHLLEGLGLWVNPYDCIWYKRDRKADGHEITRYLTNAYESFMLVGKPTEDGLPILADSTLQNVFAFDMVPQSERRHTMHKPTSLLVSILRVISTRGELGCDPSCGSGSIVEASILSGRKIEACELSESYRLAAVEATAKTMEKAHIKVEKPEDPPEELTL